MAEVKPIDVVAGGVDDDDDEENQVEEIKQETKDEMLLKACKENNLEEAQNWLAKGGSPICEKDSWNPLLWAASNGNEEMVRLLIKHNACAPYLSASQAASQDGDGAQEKAQVQQSGEEEYDPFVKPKDAQKVGKYTPLAWASYKGHYKVVWILLKQNMSPLDIDMHGNTAVHQAAASGSKKVLECFLSRGVDVEIKNARGHAPLDLATQPEVKELIQKATSTKNCANKKGCNSKFDFKNIRYYCESCKQFFCIKCSKSMWVFEAVTDKDEERSVCRCNVCAESISNQEKDLRNAMATMEFYTVDKVLKHILNNNIDIAVKLRHSAQVLHLKLEKELDIRTFIRSVDHIDDYKTILKSVKTLNDKVEAARDLEVDLDNGLLGEVNRCTQRLIAERNLRFEMESLKVYQSDHETVEKVTELIEKAQDTNVADSYRERAEKIKQQMSGNIKAREILQMLLDYPEREYPEMEVFDPKNKGKKAPPKKEEPKKKKKKKEPPFPTPDWALELDAVIAQVRNMESLLADAENLHLTPEFIQKVNGQLGRFKKEIMFRKAQEEEARLEAEAKAAAKKKSAKK